MNSNCAVFDWVSGTTIVPYLEHLPEELHDDYKRVCRERIRSIWGEGEAFFPFRRILFAARVR